MITLSFDYNGNEYRALAYEKQVGNKNHYRITVMNGELETLLHGNNIIAMDDTFPENKIADDKGNLLVQIKKSLIEYLDIKISCR